MMYIPDIESLNRNALMFAQKNDHSSMAYCVAYGGEASLQDEDGRNAVHHMALHANTEGLDYLAANDPDYFFVKDNNGQTPLVIMAEKGLTDIVLDFLTEYKTYSIACDDAGAQSVAGTLAAHGHIDFVLEKLLPLHPDILNDPVIPMVMSSQALKPKDKIKAIRRLSLAGFKAN